MTMPNLDNNTICAISTPPGVGGVAIIRVSGKNSISICDQLFNKSIIDLKGYSVLYCSISDNNQLIDDVVVTIFRSPKSFTGENVVEISCHGSSYIQQKIIESLLSKGCSMARPGEFSQRAFLNGKMDLSQTEAIADLIHSKSNAAHQTALKQMKGGFSNELKALREKLIHFASLVELELDFSEEDVEFADRKELYSLISELSEHVGNLIESFTLGNAIKNGVQTVIIGRPNAGKSTLLNGLLNEQRAIVSSTPGTTRDTIEEVLNINGIDFRFIDTAGIRETLDNIEKMGVERAIEKIESSSLIIYVYDASKEKAEQVKKDLKTFNTSDLPILTIANKADLLPSDSTVDAKHLKLSAINSKDCQKVKDEIYRLSGLNDLNLESTIVTNARHVEALQKAHADLLKVKEGMDSNVTGDFLAMDIRQVLHHLGSITGEISSDDLLGNIFANFCIGK
ncbi:MAG: tRNA uridine-5-carboxymethylaminomethyl(34) synthesis GTPase MnmE [Crocinitomicaceae bacterium]|nr:tRNA uridine-5-carboxymethylaminomethyl(34) synthesis GTPase MnmE [Crocinitomicaceae bacterium]